MLPCAMLQLRFLRACAELHPACARAGCLTPPPPPHLALAKLLLNRLALDRHAQRALQRATRSSRSSGAGAQAVGAR